MMNQNLRPDSIVDLNMPHRSHLKVSSNIKCYSCGGVNHIKNREIKAECQNTGAENNDHGRPRIWMNEH
jgi:hypothetical protein